MFNPGSVLGSSFFASREPVRDPQALSLVHACRAMASKDPSLAGSISLRRPHGQLVSADVELGTMSEDGIVDLKDYDPVRRTSMVIGLKEPSVYVPLHWLALRTHPGLNVSMLLLRESVPEGIEVFSSSLLHGSFEEAMEVVKAMKASKVPAMFISGVGLLLLAKDLEELPKVLDGLLGKERPEGKGPGPGTRGSRKGRASTRTTKPRPSKVKRHYKRGPTRRGSKGRR